MKLHSKLKKKPVKWQKHRKYEPLGFGVMGYSDEWLCPHGIGHEMGTHGCDGCCSDPSFRKLYEKDM